MIKSRFIKKKSLKKGQTLLEVVITLGLGLVIITGIMVVTINGLKNSQFAKDQSIATKLAQQGIERIRLFKDQNCPVKDGLGENYWFSDGSTSNLIYKDSLIDNEVFVITSSVLPDCLTAASLASTNLDTDMAKFPSYTRKIYLNSIGLGNAIQVTSEVSWSDFSGSHSSRISTTFSENQP